MGYNWENLVTSFLIGSSSFLEVTRTTIKSGMGSKFSKIRQGSAELASLERLEKSQDLYWEKCCEHSIAIILGWIFFILAGNKTNHKSSDEFEFGKFPSLTLELAALERLKNQWIML